MTTTSRRGRPLDPGLAHVRQFFPQWSDRTQRTFFEALKIAVAYDLDEFPAEVARLTSPGGRLNVSGLLERITTLAGFRYLESAASE